MHKSEPLLRTTDSAYGLRVFLYYALQPLLLVSVLALWLNDPTSGAAYLSVLVMVQLILGVTEHFLPARPSWVTPVGEKIKNAGLVIFLLVGAMAVGEFYYDVLTEPLAKLRSAAGLDIWPHHWPLLVQMMMVFLFSEFIWYWVHRAEHRWDLVWRISGHGAHHSFKKLGALNFGLNHPLELFFLVLPAALVELTFGVGVAAAGAAVLGVTQASIAHANIALNAKWIGLFFTTNKYHICHHSVDLDESNTNYGCSCILWDRAFGTFLDRTIEEAGTGPTEPSLWQKILMPFDQPADTTIAPE